MSPIVPDHERQGRRYGAHLACGHAQFDPSTTYGPLNITEWFLSRARAGSGHDQVCPSKPTALNEGIDLALYFHAITSYQSEKVARMC